MAVQTTIATKVEEAVAADAPSSWGARSGVRETAASGDPEGRRAAQGALHYPMLDWVRGALALIIGLKHEGILTLDTPARFALEVFFVMSGWLIGGILLDTRAEDLPRFYFRRVTRIWIPYFVAFALVMAVSLIRDPMTPRYLEFVFYKLTFVYNLFGPPQLADHVLEMPLLGTANHFWSICFEEQFYLVAPLLVVLVPPRIGRSPLLWAALFVLTLAAETHGGIALGVLAAILRARHGDWHLRPAVQAACAIVAVSCLALVSLERMEMYLGASLFALGVVLLLARRGAKSRLAAIVSGVSYQFYLSAWIGTFAAHYVMGRFGMRDAPVTAAIGIALSIASSTALYWLVDRQVLARREGWYTPRLGMMAAVSGYVIVATGLIGAALIHLTR